MGSGKWYQCANLDRITLQAPMSQTTLKLAPFASDPILRGKRHLGIRFGDCAPCLQSRGQGQIVKICTLTPIFTDPYFHVDRAFAFRQHTPKGVSPLSRVSVVADRILAPRAQTGLRLCGSHRSVFLIIVNVPYANHRLSPSHRHGKETATYPAAHPRRSATVCGVKCVN